MKRTDATDSAEKTTRLMVADQAALFPGTLIVLMAALCLLMILETEQPVLMAKMQRWVDGWVLVSRRTLI